MIRALAVACLAVGGCAPPAASRIAVTIDDLPWLGPLRAGDTPGAATERILGHLADHGAHATGFVVCDRVEGREALLKQWLAAGHELGNHSADHRSLDAGQPDAWAAGVTRCHDQLAQLAGRPPGWFRYPFLQQGRTPLLRAAGAEAVAATGERNAHVSVDTGDWLYARAYHGGVDDAPARAALREAFVAHVVASARHARDVALRKRGRDPAHVLLLHATALVADSLGEVLTALEAEGFELVPLEEALRDPIYAEEDAYVGPIGLSWLYRIAPASAGDWAFDEAELKSVRTRFVPERTALPAERIAPGLSAHWLAPDAAVIVHEEPWPANSLVVRAANGTAVLVGTPYEPQATRRALAWIRERLEPRELVAINSHFHIDGLGGNAALMEEGIPVHGSDRTVTWLAKRGEAMLQEMVELLDERPDLQALLHQAPLLPPDKVFPAEEGLVLQLGDERIEVVWPGPTHAPDNVAVWFPARRLLFGGCMLRAQPGLGNTRDADLAQWRESLTTLRRFEPTMAIPGHGLEFGPDLVARTIEELRKAGH